MLRSKTKYRPDISIYTNRLAGGGAERIIVTLLHEFVSRNLKVDLVLNQSSGYFISQLPPEVRLIDLDVLLPLREAIPKLIKYLREERPKAMLTTMHPYIEAALIAKKLSFTSTRLIIREANTLSLNAPKTQDKARWSPFLAKFLYPWADEIIAISEGVAEDLVKVAQISNKRIQVIYNPAITPNLKRMAQISLDHPWFSHGEPPVILGVGRLEPQKDFATLIKAFALVSLKQPCRLVLLGQGSQHENLQELAIELGVDNKIAMLGFQENPYQYMARAAVFVLPSAWEGFGNVVAEALALGTPVVCTNCQSGPAEIINQGKYGWLVPVGDDRTMANAILEVLYTNERRTVDTEWLEQFTVDYAARRYLDLLIGSDR